jgi:hypothetical protein
MRFFRLSIFPSRPRPGWTRIAGTPGPGNTGTRPFIRGGLIPHVAFIKIDSIFSAEVPEFVFEIYSPVVIPLVQNVVLNHGKFSSSNGKCSIAALP